MPSNWDDVCVLAIDPSINNTGISIYRLNLLNKEIKSIEAFTLMSDKINICNNFNSCNNFEKDLKLNKLQNCFLNILNIYNPSVVVCESPFFNRFRPSAYLSLVQVVDVFKWTTINFNNNIFFTELAPKTVKKIIGVNNIDVKLDVRTAVMSNSLIMKNIIDDINFLDEHSIDAIAVGYAYYFLNFNGF